MRGASYIHRSASLSVIAILLAARPAQALPSPIFFVFVSDVLIQLAVTAFLVLPFARRRLRLELIRRFPGVALRGALFGTIVTSLFLLVAGIRAGVETAAGPAPSPTASEERISEERISQESRAAPCAPLDAETAAALGFPPGSLLLDPRPPLAFRSYHLRGSCNLGRNELDAPEIRHWLETIDGPVYLVDDDLLPVGDFWEGEIPEWARRLEWREIEGGLKAFYKPNGLSFGWGRAPTTVVDQSGNPVSAQLGPVWFMGAQAPLPAWDGELRHLPETVIPRALEAGRLVIDLRGETEVPGTMWLPPAHARASHVARRTGRPPAGAVLVCNNVFECLAAEALARDSHSMGAPVFGFVRSGSRIADLVEEAASPDVPTRALAWVALILVLAALSRPLDRAFESRLPHPAAAWLRVLARLAAVLGVVHATRWLELGWTDAAWSAAEVHLLDAWRFGHWPAVLSIPVAFALWIVAGERALGRSSNGLRLGSALALVGLTFMQGKDFGELTVLQTYAVGALLAASFLADLVRPRVEAALARWSVGRGGHAVVALESAACLPWVGGKIHGLQLAAGEGLAVPASRVVLTHAAGPQSSDDVVERIAESLGEGPLVFRSSAPEEDLLDAPTPGRYASVGGVYKERFADALGQVLASYRAHGVEADAPVAVLIQRQVRGLVGVAVRAEAASGGGVRVEASSGAIDAVTAGAAAELSDHIGHHSRRWLMGGASGKLRAEKLLRLFEVLEIRLRRPLDLEWVAAGSRLLVLQARSVAQAPAEDGALGGAAGALALLGGALGWTRPDSEVLAVEDLAEFRGASRATRDLLTDLYAQVRVTRALRPLWPGLGAAGSEPPLVAIHGVLYANRTVSSPIQRAFFAAWQHAGNWVIRLTRRSVLRRLDARLRDFEEACRTDPPADLPSSPAEAAAELLKCRGRLLEGPAELALAVAYLQKLVGTANPEEDDDPLLAAASGRTVPAELLAGRANPDLRLELPREGETASGVPLPRVGQGSGEVSPSGLRARCRQVLAFHAARLRGLYLRLGVEDPFSLSVSQLEPLARGEAPSALDSADAQPLIDPPNSLTLTELERWAACGSVTSGEGRADDGVWLGRPEEVTLTVGAGPGDLHVLGLPTVESVSVLPSGAWVLAEGGTALCHAALVARSRGISGLFRAGAAVRDLRPGDRVRIQRNGKWKRVGPEVEAGISRDGWPRASSEAASPEY